MLSASVTEKNVTVQLSTGRRPFPQLTPRLTRNVDASPALTAAAATGAAPNPEFTELIRPQQLSAPRFLMMRRGQTKAQSLSIS
jgi:hypothetical protein